MQPTVGADRYPLWTLLWMELCPPKSIDALTRQCDYISGDQIFRR